LARRRLDVVCATTTPQQQQRVVAVVGGGVGGLATAAILAREGGHRVVVLEQQPVIGGRCQGEWLESPSTGRRFRFDTGPSLLLLPAAYRRAFSRMTGAPKDKALEASGLRLLRVGPDAAYRVFFTDEEEAEKKGGQPSTTPTRHLDLLYDEEAMAAQLRARAGAGAGAGAGRASSYSAWLRDARRMLDAGFDAFIARDFGTRSDGPLRGLLRMLDLRVLLPLLFSGRLPSNVLEMLEPHAQALARRFPNDPDLQALLSFQDLYVGLSPQTAPGVFSLLAATELQDGVWYAQGGFGAVRDALRRAAMEAGDVEVRTGARVRRVVVSGAGEGGDGRGEAVTGVEVEDVGTGDVAFLRADAVVCNADVPGAYGLLSSDGGGGGGGGGGSSTSPASSYGAQVSSQLLDKGEYSAGVIAYYWCVEGGALTQLPQHTVFVRSGGGGEGGGAAKAWRRARSAAELESSPNFYVHCPARTDPTAVSPSDGGGDSVMVLLPVANLQEVAKAKAAGAAARGGAAPAASSSSSSSSCFDDELVAAGRAAILRALAAALPGTLAEAGGAADLPDHIVREEVRAPPEWARRHALAHGAAFGLAHGLDQLAAFRPAVKDGRVQGLYFVGASARPGNGVPLVLTGAGLCADAVEADLCGR
jgi:phytoene desaturase (3,4-didehydrolycopene-forming)